MHPRKSVHNWKRFVIVVLNGMSNFLQLMLTFTISALLFGHCEFNTPVISHYFGNSFHATDLF